MNKFHKGVSALTSLILLLSLSSVSIASDREKEKRWAAQVTDAILDGEPLNLNDGEADFLAIDTRAEEPKDTAIIVIHGIGIHPDWEQVVQPLRVQLAEEGWNTLSLQMPVLPNEATDKDYDPLMKEAPARIDAGIRYLSKEGAKKVVIVAHSMGARMASYYLAHKTVYKEAKTETPIVAFVGIGMGEGNSEYLAKIKMPVMDLYGSKDLDDVLKFTPDRAKASKENKQYQQNKVEGANHFFDEKNDELLEAVTTFVKGLK